MESTVETLKGAGLRRFLTLQTEAANAVADRFYAVNIPLNERFFSTGREACREDLAFHLEFLRPALEFGMLQPMVDYLHWLSGVLTARGIPVEHLALSLDWLADFFTGHMDEADGLIVASALYAARTQLLDTRGAPLPPPKSPESWPEAEIFEEVLLKGDQREALAIVNRCLDNGGSLVDVELYVMQPALYGIGTRWQANQISVAQEHMATAIVQSVMTASLLRCQSSAPINQCVLLACVEGNHHTVGLRMVADAFLLAGWEVEYLGENVPTKALCQQVIEWKPNLVGLSVSFPHHLPVARSIIAQLKDVLGHARPAVIIGGLAINRFNELAKMVGADAFGSDAQTAVSCANKMLKNQNSL
jgi:methanogenic corrinoid protein MtbC1